MEIAILGAGNVGSVLGHKLAAGGYAVVFGVRDPQGGKAQALRDAAGRLPANIRLAAPAEAVAATDVIVLAVPFSAVQALLADLGSLSGKILVDATNPFPAPPEGFSSGAQAIAAWSGGGRVVKAFNNTGWENLADPDYAGTRVETYLCADDPQARQMGAQLARAAGLQPVDLGGLQNAGLSEALARLWVGLARQTSLGRQFALQIVRRPGA